MNVHDTKQLLRPRVVSFARGGLVFGGSLREAHIEVHFRSEHAPNEAPLWCATLLLDRRGQPRIVDENEGPGESCEWIVGDLLAALGKTSEEDPPPLPAPSLERFIGLGGAQGLRLRARAWGEGLLRAVRIDRQLTFNPDLEPVWSHLVDAELTTLWPVTNGDLIVTHASRPVPRYPSWGMVEHLVRHAATAALVMPVPDEALRLPDPGLWVGPTDAAWGRP